LAKDLEDILLPKINNLSCSNVLLVPRFVIC